MFGIISDTHQHNWSAFATVNEDGVNSRNQITLDETIRAAKEIKAAGGSVLIHAGDLFHVRGNIAPSVLNPTLEAYRYIIEDLEMKVIMIPGNHDMEGKDSLKNTNAVEALASVGVYVCSHQYVTKVGEEYIIAIPWRSSVDQLKIELEELAFGTPDIDKTNVVIHAPVDDVIEGIPDHGLTSEYLGNLGFKRVFSGHYHNYKDFGNNVYSVGALNHQTWGDVNAKAGFLLVDGDVVYRASHAPSFVDLDPDTSVEDVPLIVDGNYIRVRMEIEKESQIADMREFLIESGAAGVVIHPVRDTSVVARSGSTVKSGATIAASVADFIKLKEYKRSAELGRLCSEILSESEEE